MDTALLLTARSAIDAQCMVLLIIDNFIVAAYGITAPVVADDCDRSMLKSINATQKAAVAI